MTLLNPITARAPWLGIAVVPLPSLLLRPLPGARTATVIVTDNSNNVAGSTQNASLTGTGSGATINLTPSSLSFGSQAQSTTSAALSVTLTNQGNATLNLTSATITGANSGDFALSGNTCGSTVTAGNNCTLSVTFTPSTVTAESAAITLVGQRSSESPIGRFERHRHRRPDYLSLRPVRQLLQPKCGYLALHLTPITVTKHGNCGSFTINGVSVTGANKGDFSESTTCSAVLLPVNATCTITVTFSPAAPLTHC